MSPLSLTTGTMRPVQRNFYDPSSAPGKGIVWEWESDCGSWTPYDMELCVSIQNAYEKQHPWLDLSSLGFSYVVDFDGMSQTNRQSQRKRRIRRRMDLAYPLIAGSIPKSQSWPVGTSSGTPCSCQQCMLVHSTRVASNAILALQQRRKLYGTGGGATAVVRQSNTFAGSSLWSPATAVARGHHNNISVGGGGGGGGKVEMNGVKLRCAPAIVTLPSNHALTINGQNNLNRPGMQRITVTASRGSVPPG